MRKTAAVSQPSFHKTHRRTSSCHLFEPAPAKFSVFPFDKLFKPSKSPQLSKELDAKHFIRDAIQENRTLTPHDFHRFITQNETGGEADSPTQIARLHALAEILTQGTKDYKAKFIEMAKQFAQSQRLGWPDLSLKKNKDVSEALGKLVKDVVKFEKAQADQEALLKIDAAEKKVASLIKESGSEVRESVLCGTQDPAFRVRLAEDLVSAFEEGHHLDALESELKKLMIGLFHLSEREPGGGVPRRSVRSFASFMSGVIDLAGDKLFQRNSVRIPGDKIKQQLLELEKLSLPYVEQAHRYYTQLTARHAACAEILSQKMRDVSGEVDLILGVINVGQAERDALKAEILAKLQQTSEWRYATYVETTLRLKLEQVKAGEFDPGRLRVKDILDPDMAKVLFKADVEYESPVTRIERHFCIPAKPSESSDLEEETFSKETLLGDESKKLGEILEALYVQLYTQAVSVFEERQLSEEESEDVALVSPQSLDYQHMLELAAKMRSSALFPKNAFGPMVGSLAANTEFRESYRLKTYSDEEGQLSVSVSSPEPKSDHESPIDLETSGEFVSSYQLCSVLPLTQASVKMAHRESSDPHVTRLKAIRIQSEKLTTHYVRRQGTEGVFSISEDAFKARPLGGKLELLQNFRDSWNLVLQALGPASKMRTALLERLFPATGFVERLESFEWDLCENEQAVLNRLVIGDRGLAGRLSRPSSKTVSRQSSQDLSVKPLTLSEFVEAASVTISLGRLLQTMSSMVDTFVPDNITQVWIFRESFMRSSDKSEKLALNLSHRCNQFLASLENDHIPLHFGEEGAARAVIVRQRLHNTPINNGSVFIEPVFGDHTLEQGIETLYFSQLDQDIQLLNQKLDVLRSKPQLREIVTALQSEISENHQLQRELSQDPVNTGILGSNTVLTCQIIMRMARLFELAQLLIEKQGRLADPELAVVCRALNCKSALDRTRIGQDTTIADSVLGLTTSQIVQTYALVLPEAKLDERAEWAGYREPLPESTQLHYRSVMLAQGPLHEAVLSSARILSSNQPNGVNVACDYDQKAVVYGVPVKQITDFFNGFTKA